MESFGARLASAVAAKGPLCVGIDPHAELMARWGLPDTPAGLREFCATVVDAVADLVPVLKPQSAFFERFGSAGIAVLESTIRQCRARGALVLLDVKRGDIGSTMRAYAQAYLDPTSPLCVDAITVSPYLGFGSLAPVLDLAEAHGGGAFVLALTSNEEGREVQQARVGDGRTVARVVLDHVAERNVDASPLGSIGVVVGATIGAVTGATIGAAGGDLGRLNGPVLAPGLGAQGATAADLGVVFAGVRGLVLPSSSRDILVHGPTGAGVREAAMRTMSTCRQIME